MTKFNSLTSTDLYELTMAQVYFKKEMLEEAVFEVYTRTLPKKRGYLLYAGLEPVLEFIKNARFNEEDLNYLSSLRIFETDFLDYLKNLKFTGKIYSLPEGSVVTHTVPLLAIKAPLPIAQILESAVLNIITFETLIATKASRIREVAGDRLLMDFALRRVHGLEAGYHVARASYIGGFDGTSNVYAGKKLGIPVYGTMAHSYILAFEDEEKAFTSYFEQYGEKSVFLVDTFDTEKGIEKGIKVAKEMEKKEKKLLGIRIDSGDLEKESKRARKALDRNGLDYVKIIASGSLDEYSIEELLRRRAPIDGFGVGTKLGVSADIPYLDTAYKLVEYKGKGVMKTSKEKETLPFLKSVRRKWNQKEVIYEIGIRGEFDEEMLLEVPLNEPLESLPEIKNRANNEVKSLPQKYRNIHNPSTIDLRISDRLQREKERLKETILE